MLSKILPVFLLLIVLGEVYTCHLIYKFTKRKLAVIVYLLFLAGMILGLIYYFNGMDRSKGQTAESMHIMAFLVFFLLPKVVFTTAYLIEDIFRLSRWSKNKFISKQNKSFHRSRIFTRIVLSLTVFVALSIIYGIFIGKYNYKVRQEIVHFETLPPAFNGMRILHISDLHVGSWDNKKAIEKGIRLINEQSYDLLVFTGDFVNTLASEAAPWTAIIRQIKTPKYGKYAILGNHDYGEYVVWPNEEAKAKNFEEIKRNIEKSGFTLLMNENIALSNHQDTIYLLGVENWGTNFKKVGDLKKTTDGVSTNDFKIVLTHDPSHWTAEIVGHPQQYQLTLSGHTHGMQFGIDIPGIIEWSPSKYIYPEWGGLYQQKNQYLYVNRGFGFHAYSGRIGIWPEITVIELKKTP